jgi:hypothetical protein
MSLSDDILDVVQTAIKTGKSPREFTKIVEEAWLIALSDERQNAQAEFEKMLRSKP